MRQLRIVCIFYVCCDLEESSFISIFKKECIVWKLLLTILFSDFVSFGFSTTDIVIEKVSGGWHYSCVGAWRKGTLGQPQSSPLLPASCGHHSDKVQKYGNGFVTANKRKTTSLHAWAPLSCGFLWRPNEKSNLTNYSKHFLKYAILITQFCIK